MKIKLFNKILLTNEIINIIEFHKVFDKTIINYTILPALRKKGKWEDEFYLVTKENNE
jgi:hypothetical protein